MCGIFRFISACSVHSTARAAARAQAANNRRMIQQARYALACAKYGAVFVGTDESGAAVIWSEE